MPDRPISQQSSSNSKWRLTFTGLIAIILFLFLLLIFIGKVPDQIEDRIQIAIATFTGVALLIALVQAWLANQQTKQTLMADVLLRLYEMYTKRDMHRAIADVWQAVNQDGREVSTAGEFLKKNSSRYQFLKGYVEGLSREKGEEFDESRRMVTHFWYLIANLLDKETIQEEDVFRWFGPPDVIWPLEGLEVIKQNLDMGGIQKTLWPPLQVLKRYYKKEEKITKVLDGAMIPIGHISPEIVEQIKRFKYL